LELAEPVAFVVAAKMRMEVGCGGVVARAGVVAIRVGVVPSPTIGWAPAFAGEAAGGCAAIEFSIAAFPTKAGIHATG
jgi:hypothetical protein